MGIFARLRRKSKERNTDEKEGQRVEGELEHIAKEVVNTELVELCRRSIENPFTEKYKNVEVYVQIHAFQNMKEMIRIMEILEDKYLEQQEYRILKVKLQEFIKNKNALDVAAKNLETVRLSLTQEILSFTQIVKEVGERYKLSPNWEGKKPVLIEKQKELERKKSKYEKNERELDKCFRVLYQEFKDLDQGFQKLSKEIMKIGEGHKK